MEIQHLNIDNYSKKLTDNRAYQNFSPDCILAVEKDISGFGQYPEFAYKQKMFKKLWSQDSVSVFKH